MERDASLSPHQSVCGPRHEHRCVFLLVDTCCFLLSCVVTHPVLFPPSERDYWSLCVKQPIGKKQFELFCQSRPELHNHICLLDALVHMFTFITKTYRANQYSGGSKWQSGIKKTWSSLNISMMNWAELFNGAHSDSRSLEPHFYNTDRYGSSLYDAASSRKLVKTRIRKENGNMSHQCRGSVLRVCSNARAAAKHEQLSGITRCEGKEMTRNKEDTSTAHWHFTHKTIWSMPSNQNKLNLIRQNIYPD